MKKIFVLMMTLVATLALVSCGGPTLSLYNWGEYIDPDLLKAFKEETGISVRTTYFASNELAITQMQNNQKFDIAVPSEYAVEQMAALGLLEEIDWSLVDHKPEATYTEGLNAILEGLKTGTNGYDYLQYAVPYFWGNVGLLYNTDKVSEEALETYGWGILGEDDYKVSFYDTSREGLLVALKHLGYSMNSSNPVEINEAKNWLVDVKNRKGSNVSYVADGILTQMIDPTDMFYDISVAYSGDAVYLMSENEKLGFFSPNEGTNVWVDGMVIPKGANQEYAYQFINFMMREENALANTEYVGYSSPIKTVFNEVIAEDGIFHDYADSYSVDFRSGFDEFFRYNQQAKALIDQAWTDVKKD